VKIDGGGDKKNTAEVRVSENNEAEAECEK